jgi:hypothetical protein
MRFPQSGLRRFARVFGRRREMNGGEKRAYQKHQNINLHNVTTIETAPLQSFNTGIASYVPAT